MSGFDTDKDKINSLIETTRNVMSGDQPDAVSEVLVEGEITFKSTRNDWRIAFNGIRTQAKAHGVDPNASPEMAKFIEHLADVISQHVANERGMMNIIHAPDFENAKEAVEKQLGKSFKKRK